MSRNPSVLMAVTFRVQRHLLRLVSSPPPFAIFRLTIAFCEGVFLEGKENNRLLQRSRFYLRNLPVLAMTNRPILYLFQKNKNMQFIIMRNISSEISFDLQNINLLDDARGVMPRCYLNLEHKWIVICCWELAILTRKIQRFKSSQLQSRTSFILDK
jgi:hypothetical protein